MPPTGPIRALTPLQQDIAALIGTGKSYREIGEELGISEHTVADYVVKMALLFEEYDDLPPRWRIYVWVKYCEWRARPPAGSAGTPPAGMQTV